MDVRQMDREMRKATPHHQGLGRLLAVFDTYHPEVPPPIDGWEGFELFWKTWFPNTLLQIYRGPKIQFLARPPEISADDPLAFEVTVKTAFTETVHYYVMGFLQAEEDGGREGLLQAITEQVAQYVDPVEYGWVLEPPSKRGLLRQLFG